MNLPDRSGQAKGKFLKEKIKHPSTDWKALILS